MSNQKSIKIKKLNKELEKGEKCGFLKNFDRKAFLKDLDKRYSKSKS